MARSTAFLWAILLTVLFTLQPGEAVGQRDDLEIHLQSRSFVPPEQIDENLEAQLATPSVIDFTFTAAMEAPVGAMQLMATLASAPAKSVHAVIQFRKPLTAKDHEFLRQTGIQLQGYLGNNVFSASIPKGTALDEGFLAKIIRFADIFEPRDKIKVRLAREQFAPWALSLTEPQRISVLVQFFPDVADDMIGTVFESLKLKAERYGAENSWEVDVTEKQIEILSQLDAVKMIQQGPVPFLPLNDTSRRVANTDAVQRFRDQNGRPIYDGASGLGVRIGVSDSGIDEKHNDFDDIAQDGSASASRVYSVRPGGRDHGTHVASIAAGSGFNSVNNNLPAFSRRGHAPRVEIGDYRNFGGSIQLLDAAINDDRTDITNNSYVQSEHIYDAGAQSIDQIIRGDAVHNGRPVPPRPQVWAAGNNGIRIQYGVQKGYYSVFTSAKNTISVGSVDTRDGRLSKFSSLGPSLDGRIKPDVVAPGCADSIASPSEGIEAAAVNTQGYIGACGTSMAAPTVAGILALMMEQYEQTFGMRPTLLPSTFKAMLVQTAGDMVKTAPYADREFNNPDTGRPVLYHAGPDYATGFGLVDAEAAAALVAARDQWRQSQLSLTKTEEMFCVEVPEGAGEIKATIAWDDASGDPMTAESVTKLVNDLDLILTTPNGTTLRSWTLDPLPRQEDPLSGSDDPIKPTDIQPAFRGEDRLNNVEMASVANPKTGVWKVTIQAFNLPLGTPQPYSLAASHPIAENCP